MIKTLAGIIGGALLAVGMAVPAQASPAATGCVSAVGVCGSGFCSTTSFGSGDWWFAFLGGKGDSSYWDAYYYAGSSYVLYGEVSPTGC